MVKKNAVQQAQVAIILNNAQSQYSQNASNVTVQSALAAAATDPVLIAKYADALKMDSASFMQGLTALQTATSTQAQQYQQQFEAERKALAEQQAAAGAAYSGFRGKAQQDLSNTESGIVTSSRSQLQQQLNQLTSSFESKYGTSATPSASVNFADPYAGAGTSISGLNIPGANGNSTISGQLAGGVTGTQIAAKQADINAEAQQMVALGTSVPITPVSA